MSFWTESRCFLSGRSEESHTTNTQLILILCGHRFFSARQLVIDVNLRPKACAKFPLWRGMFRRRRNGGMYKVCHFDKVVLFTSPWCRLRRHRPPSKGEFTQAFCLKLTLIANWRTQYEAGIAFTPSGVEGWNTTVIPNKTRWMILWIRNF